MTKLSFANARTISEPKPPQCSFYQTFDWPDGQLIRGRWDYRHDPDAYVGRLDFDGKTVLELGPASGFLTQHMESLGGDVVCIDTGPDLPWEVVPRVDQDAEAYRATLAGSIHQVHNSWWASHTAFESTARISYIGAAGLADIDETFDVGLIGSILQHFVNPYLILSYVARMCDTVVVTEPILPRLNTDRPLIEFAAKPDNDFMNSWYLLSPEAVHEMMQTLGFERVDQYQAVFRRYDLTEPDIAIDSFVDRDFDSQVFVRR